jgi:hypothetical protein
MDRHELAWAAGFFDGEGWANRSRRGVQSRINQSDNDGVPNVLVRFKRIVGCGRIHGPVREDGRQDLYYWDVSSRSDVEALTDAIWPWLGDVKRAEFRVALSRVPTVVEEDLPRSELLAWAGGLYDGEGSASLSPHRTHAGHFSPEVALTQSGTACPQVLERLRDIVGCGRIYGPYTQEGATLPVFRWKAAALSDVEYSLYVLRTLDRVSEARTSASRLACAGGAGPAAPREHRVGQSEDTLREWARVCDGACPPIRPAESESADRYVHATSYLLK